MLGARTARPHSSAKREIVLDLGTYPLRLSAPCGRGRPRSQQNGSSLLLAVTLHNALCS